LQYITVVYIVTIIISVAIALLLAHIARLSAQAKVKGKGSGPASTDLLDEEDLNKAIADGLYNIVDSDESRRKVSKAVSGIFAEELEKRVRNNTKQLDDKYNGIVEQKTQSEEIAWKKYMKVLSGKKETDAVIRSIAEGLVVVDGKGNVVMMNPAAEKLLDVTKKEKIGKSVLADMKQEQLVSMVKESSDGKDKEIEIMSNEDETKKILRSSSAVIEDENGQTVGMVSMLSDITKQKELDEMKARFVANVTHELRTPMVAVQKAISLLLAKAAGNVTDTQQEFLDLAERNLKKLSRLIDDLLDLSKLEAGRMDVKKEPCQISNVIRDTVASLETWSSAKDIKVEQKAQDGLPNVIIDPQRIGQVITNLIGNAIKFTPKEGLIIVKAVSREGKEIEVSVQDTGPGIPASDLDKVFDRFYQTGERNLTDVSGTGVGLSIAKEIVELHGGRIWAESEKDSGAKFTFTIPTKQ
jgi:PAS domain S-box-containing protein